MPTGATEEDASEPGKNHLMETQEHGVVTRTSYSMTKEELLDTLHGKRRY